jgi:hypothetical protein
VINQYQRCAWENSPGLGPWSIAVASRGNARNSSIGSGNNVTERQLTNPIRAVQKNANRKGRRDVGKDNTVKKHNILNHEITVFNSRIYSGSIYFLRFSAWHINCKL